MSEAAWHAVDRFFEAHLLRSDPVLEESLRAAQRAGIPDIQVAPLQGRLLELLARIQGARAILELGTLAGYSTIFLARGMADGGRLATLEVEPTHADVARENIARAGLADRVDLRVGPALDTLPALEREGAGPFDLIFIDADKSAYPEYLEWALRLARPGTLIVGDNVVRGGRVADRDATNASVRGSRRFIELVGEHPRLIATAIQTVGAKGYDGFALALVLA
jgi:predicted O-methyltransferase YrrM